MRTFAVLILLIGAVWAEQFSYEGYKVYRVHPSGKEQLDALASLRGNNHIDFWSPIRRDGTQVDVMVDPHAQVIFVKFLERSGINHEILIDNVESLNEQERVRQSLAPRVQQGRISFTQYHTFDEINAYIDQLAKDHSDIVSVETIGQSYEGRDLNIIKISTNPNANKPIIFVDAGIHAREWAAPAVALYIINQLVENSDNANLLEKIDWHILPVLNPDGYEYTHDAERFWRKTRSPTPRAGCQGTDGNRNFEFHWAETGSSSYECDEDYHGTKPFSEVETAAVRDYGLRNKDNIKLYLTFHSYGPLILYPWGYTSAYPEDSPELQALGDKVADTIYAVDRTWYEVGSSTNVLYAAAGGSDDWFKGVAGVELSYTIELPPGGWIGFDPPPSDILPIVTETWEGIKVYHQYVSDKFA